MRRHYILLLIESDGFTKDYLIIIIKPSSKAAIRLYQGWPSEGNGGEGFIKTKTLFCIMVIKVE